jgi:hypothetical protein
VRQPVRQGAGISVGTVDSSLPWRIPRCQRPAEIRAPEARSAESHGDWRRSHPAESSSATTAPPAAFLKYAARKRRRVRFIRALQQPRPRREQLLLCCCILMLIVRLAPDVALSSMHLRSSRGTTETKARTALLIGIKLAPRYHGGMHRVYCSGPIRGLLLDRAGAEYRAIRQWACIRHPRSWR